MKTDKIMIGANAIIFFIASKFRKIFRIISGLGKGDLLYW
jgi:hypothetical protein